jgi:hypothetical protein
MALPLPRVVPDVGPGGGLVTAMGGINKLSNDMILRKINEIKKQYMPLTTQAEAASKLAYANLMGPQFLAKLLGNDSAIANMGDSQAKQALQQAVNAGMGGGNASNIFAQMQQQSQGPGQKLGNSLSNFFADKLKGVFGGQGQPGMGQMPGMGQPQQQAPQQMPQMQNDAEQQSAPMAPPMGRRPKDGVTLEGEQWYNAKGEPVYEEEETTPEGTMKLELTKGIPSKSYAQNTGEYKGTVKQLEKEGEYRAAALKQIGESQLGLSNSGAVLDRMTGIIKNPVFANMRNKIPGFQNKQLDYLKVMGTPEEKELIGDFLSTGESFIASTVQGFSGKPLVREFDLAQRQKITPHDTVESAIGKLQSATALHDIAEQKNQIVSELLQKGYNEADAVKLANKMIDVRSIEKATKERLQRKIQVRNNKTGVTKMVTLEEARKMGVPNV